MRTRLPALSYLHISLLGVLTLHVSSSSAEGWRVSADSQVRVIASDNINFSPVDPASDTLTELTPSVGVTRNSPRLQLNARYSPRLLYYADETLPSRISNNLNATGTLEVVDDLFFLNGRASVSERPRSVFNAQPNLVNSTAGESTQTRAFSLSPSLRGTFRLGDVATWKSSYTIARSESSRNQGTVTARTFNGTLKGAPAKLGWQADVSSRTSQSDSARSSKRESVTGSLIFRPDAELELTGRYGYEESSLDRQRDGAVYGAGIDWNPTPRTSFSIDRDERPYGSTASFSLSHRLPRTVFNSTYSRSVVSRADTLLAGSGLEELYATLSLTEPYASIIDPVERMQTIEADARAGKIPGIGSVDTPVLADSEFLSTRWQVSAVHNAPRDTFSLTLFRSTSDSGTGSRGTPSGDFVLSPVIEQRGWTVAMSHRLGTTSSLNFSFSAFDTTGTRSSNQQSKRDIFNATFSTGFGAYTSGSIGLRMMRGTVTAGDVEENAVIATVSTRFN